MIEARRAPQDIIEVISKLALFDELSVEQLNEIAAESREIRLPKGEVLFHKDDQAHGFYVVISGQVKLAFPSAQGNEKVVEILGARQSFGEALMFMNRPYPVFAEAVVESLLVHIPQAPVKHLLQRDSSFACAMLAGLSKRLHSLGQDVEAYSVRSSAQRVIGYLLQLSPDGDTGAVEILLPTSKNVIASRLNLTPETLSRIFHDLAKSRLIEVRGKHILIHDVQRLKKFGV